MKSSMDVLKVPYSTIGWISDSTDWVESLIACIEDLRMTHVRWESMEKFIQNQRFCDVIVVDVGEVNNDRVMKYVAENTTAILLVSGFNASVTKSVVDSVAECFPDHFVHYAAMEPDTYLRGWMYDGLDEYAKGMRS